MLLRHAPTVDELLADGLIQAVMRADRVDPRALKTMLGGVASRIVARREAAPKRFGSVFAVPRLTWRPNAGDADGAPLALPAPIADACGAAMCC